ncbi:MAG TPA: hypothetical protein VFZ34_32365 [Blastocatellia bacterium]|nr:hypothetical protein [Blastocatellia bacterium]
MKKLTSLSGLILALLFIVLPSFAQEQDFCWKDTSTRGVGTVPQACEAGRERIGLLCYTKCPAGMKRVGFDCQSVCPDGLRDDGLFCRAAEYGRGAGYPWKVGDKAFSLDDARARCTKENPQGCEQDGAIIYPKCKPGYKAFGCCICRPEQPNCSALGLKPGVDLSCAKQVTIGDPVPGVCGSNEQRDAGLCYSNCASGFTGVGPVCWGGVPKVNGKDWVDCGMGAAKDSFTCAKIVANQVVSVGNLALTIGSLGTSTSLTAGLSAPAKASRLTKITQEFTKLKTQWEVLQKTNQNVKLAVNAFKAANAGRQGYVAMETIGNATTEEDMVRAAAQIAAILDPSGVAGVVAAYTYPKCSKYFPTN